VAAELLHADTQADRQPDGETNEDSVAFLSFAKAPKDSKWLLNPEMTFAETRMDGRKEGN
jgi:hypothetical protein